MNENEALEAHYRMKERHGKLAGQTRSRRQENEDMMASQAEYERRLDACFHGDEE